MSEQVGTPVVAVEEGRVYGGKTPGVVTQNGRLFADDRQVVAVHKTGAGKLDYEVEFTTAAKGEGETETATAAAFVDWAGADVSDLLAPGLPDGEGKQAAQWRPWHEVSVKPAAANINQTPAQADVLGQLPAGSQVLGTAEQLGGKPDAAQPKKPAKSTEKAPANKKAADTKKVPAATVTAANAANAAAVSTPGKAEGSETGTVVEVVNTPATEGATPAGIAAAQATAAANAQTDATRPNTPDTGTANDTGELRQEALGH